MNLRICPDCGGSLDPAEKCDCTKKEDAPGATGTASKKDSTTCILALERDSVNPGVVELSDLVFPGKVLDKDIVAAVQEIHCKYDKTLHSKCKRGAEYGIQLRRSAIDAVTRKLGAVVHTAPKCCKSDKRTLSRRISCRLSESVYGELQLSIQEDGYDTMQDFLLHLVRDYIKYQKNDGNKEREAI